MTTMWSVVADHSGEPSEVLHLLQTLNTRPIGADWRTLGIDRDFSGYS